VWQELQNEAAKLLLRTLLEQLMTGDMQKFEDPVLLLLSGATGYPVEDLRRVQEQDGMESFLRQSLGEESPGGDQETFEEEAAVAPARRGGASQGQAGRFLSGSGRTAAGAGVPEDYELLEHVTGIRLRHPPDWSNQGQGGGIALVPSDAPSGPDGPREVYVLLTFSIPDEARESPEAFVAVADRQMIGDGSAFARSGAPDWLDGEPGGRLLLRYRSVQDGGGTLVHAYVYPKDPLACALMAVGDPEALAGHEAAARTVFDSIEFAPGARDGSLAGSWFYSDGYASSGFSMATQVEMVLGEDGSFSRSSSAAGGTMDVGVSSDGEAEIGTWFARDGALVLLYASGETVQFQYSLVDGRLVTVNDNGGRTIWSR
jgi:hypothetical protein